MNDKSLDTLENTIRADSNKILANSISDLADKFQALSDSESKSAGAYGLMKASAVSHLAKSEAYDICAAKVRVLLTKIEGEGT